MDGSEAIEKEASLPLAAGATLLERAQSTLGKIMSNERPSDKKKHVKKCMEEDIECDENPWRMHFLIHRISHELANVRYADGGLLVAKEKMSRIGSESSRQGVLD